MKPGKLFLGIANLILVLSTTAQAIPPKAEAVLVKEINQTANLMPIVPPGGRPSLTNMLVEVKSNGCTKSEDFKVKALQTRSGQFMEIVRIRPDVCEAVPHRTTVELETRALNLATRNPIILVNPVYTEERIIH